MSAGRTGRTRNAIAFRCVCVAGAVEFVGDGAQGIPGRATLLHQDQHLLYVAYTKKTNRTSYKDADVLARFLEVVSDRRLKEISPFHLEKWKSNRAKDVSQSTVNRELNILSSFGQAAAASKTLQPPPAVILPG